MRVVLGILASLIGMWVLSANIQAEEATAQPGAFYQGLEPGAFMKEWLVCGPFSVFDGPKDPNDLAAQREGFDRDFLTEHGGETTIRPTTKMIHQRNGEEYRWRKAKSPTDIVNLIRHLGYEKYSVGYAWAQIDMPAETPALLGIGSDDAVKVWLNGKLVHENWTSRAAKADDDLAPVTFQTGPNILLLKIQNNTESWGFTCRRLDPNTLGDKLLTAVQSGDPNAVQMCLSYGVRLDVTDKYGFTPAQVAKMRGQQKILQMLVDKGADPNVALPAVGTPVGFLDLLWSSLKENYPMMEYAGAFDDSWYEACKERIQGTSGLYEALPVMDAMLVQRLNDYHTGMYWEGKQGLDRPALILGWIENQVVVTRCANKSGISPGDVVLEIDGADATEEFKRQWPDSFGATSYARARSACERILEGETGSQIHLKLANEQGEIYEKTLTRGEDRRSLFSPDPTLSSRSVDDRVGYIRIRGWSNFKPEEFDRLLEPFRDKPCLILDVRDNGGGSDDLAETVIGRFLTHKIVASVSFQRQAGTNIYEKIIDVVSPRGPWRYSGKVAVLTNEGCASACEHFVSGMREAGVLLVGMPTIGACGWSKEIELPVGVTLRCSLTFPLHGKTPSPLNGIEPNCLVAPTIADLRAGRDTVLEKAMALLNP